MPATTQRNPRFLSKFAALGRMRRMAGKAVRVLVSALALSATGLVGLVAYEGYTDKAVIPTQGDVPTLGFGSTTREDGSPVRMGDRTTPTKALARTLAYLQDAETEMRRTLQGVALTQGEYDVYVDWRYQYGGDAWAGSSMLRELRAGNYVAACDALLQYRKLTSARNEGPGWAVSRRNAQGLPTRWEFDCSTPGNKVCRGVWTRQLERHAKCMEAQP